MVRLFVFQFKQGTGNTVWLLKVLIGFVKYMTYFVRPQPLVLGYRDETGLTKSFGVIDNNHS